jgi:hypothetical protein
MENISTEICTSFVATYPLDLKSADYPSLSYALARLRRGSPAVLLRV